MAECLTWLVHLVLLALLILVFFPGGRGKDKAWIITLPDNAGFNEVPEENVSKVLTYLTSVPRYEAPCQPCLWWAGGWVLPG